MLPTRAQSMFSGNNNTSYCLTAYLCKNAARGGIWSASVLFFEITSLRYVPFAVVMFSLPYQFCRNGKFCYRAYLVCHSQMPSPQVCVLQGAVRAFSFRFLHFKRQLKCVFERACGSTAICIFEQRTEMAVLCFFFFLNKKKFK